MAQYNFVSPGAAAGNAIEQFLMQRALDEREAQAQQFRQQQAIEAGQRQAEELALQRQQESRVAEAQRQQIADLENQRAFTRASTIAEHAMPGDAVDDPTAQLLRAQGFGGQIYQTQPTQGAYLGDDEQMVPQYNVVPGILQMRGGSRYLNAEAQRQAQAQQAEANRQAAAERASEANATREEIARLGASGRSETTALRNELTGLRIDAERTKQEDKKAADQKNINAMRTYGDDMLAVIGELIDEHGNLKPGAAGVVGTIEGAVPESFMYDSDRQNAIAAIKRLNSNLSIETLQRLKEQSRTGATGFGSLTEKELALVENARSTLSNRRQSEANFAAELKRIRDVITSGRGPAPSAAPQSGGTRVGRFEIVDVK